MGRMISWLSGLIRNRQRIRDDQAFVTLMQVAMESPGIRAQLIALLALPGAQRQALIQTWITELQAEEAPGLLTELLRRLADEPTAARALALLDDTEQGDT